MLEVKFAEVVRNKSKDWQAAMGLINQGQDLLVGAGVNQLSGKFVTGFNNDGSPKYDIRPVSASGGGIPNVGIDPGSLLLNFAGNAANIFIHIDNFTAALQLLESEGLARTLAEPRLVTLSGQEASFLAGGEFPYPVPDDNGNPAIEFKEFGVGLRFTPVVMADGRISMHVAPSVSEISGTSIIPFGVAGTFFPIPNLSTRKLETTVHLKDGQTLALAGLLQDNLRETVSKVPGLGDLPIIGALFRSTSYLQQKTDLMVAVTPHIVKPVAEGDLHFPGEFIKLPSQYEFYLEGRLEGRRSGDDPSALQWHESSVVPGMGGQSGGLEGSSGFRATTN
jgi:pilus assembly protein CpaC